MPTILVNIQSFIKHDFFYSSFNQLKQTTHTHTQKKTEIIVLLSVWCFVYTRGNFAHWINKKIWIFQATTKISDGPVFICWCGHHVMPTPTKEKRLPHSGKSMKNKSLPHCLHLDFSHIYFQLLSLTFVLRCCCLFACDKSANHFSIDEICTQFSVKPQNTPAIPFTKMLHISFHLSWIFNSSILAFPHFWFTFKNFLIQQTSE